MEGDLNDKIEQLERAIKQLDSVKRHLLQNATEIKGQVQTTMSRHLEALRNREVWLLSQVDLVLSAKEAVLQAQQARLNQMLGVLQSAIGLTSDSNMDTLVDTLHNRLDINFTDLNPEETAFFTFRADPADLRNTILNYGHVDADGMPLTGGFHEPESETLPRHFEDYEGPDHHIFHKTVGGNMQPNDRGIYVNIPKLSTNTEDWLLRPTTQTTNTDTSPRFSFPQFTSNSLVWIKQKSPTTPGMTSPTRHALSSDASINDWLCQIKRYADPEEEDFEVVENCGLSSTSSESYSSCSNTSTKPTLMNLDLVKLEFPSAVQKWLKSNKSTPEEKPEEFMTNFFQHIPSDPDLWLMNCPEKTKTCEDCSSGISTDIESLGDRFANLTVMSNFYRSCPSDKQCWLKSDDKPVIIVPDVKDVCRANELCEGFVDCVCSPHCGLQHIGITDADNWLITNKMEDTEIMKESCQNKAICGLENWLSPFKPNSNTSITYSEESSTESLGWIQEKDNYKHELYLDAGFGFKHGTDDPDLWLSPNRVEECPVEDSQTWNIIKDQHSKLSSSDWLLKTSYGQSHQRDNRDYWLSTLS